MTRIPTSLWHGGNIHLAPNLSSAYHAVLQSRGLFAIAQAGLNEQRIIGGASVADTLKHFQFRFEASAARVQACAMAPTPTLESVSAHLLGCLRSGKVQLLDIPCGTGAATAALVGTIMEYRRSGNLPCLPLRLDVFGADISSSALEVFSELMAELKPAAAEWAIELSWRTKVVDAFVEEDVGRLCDAWLIPGFNEPQDYLTIVANFSGELGKDSTKTKFEPSLNHLRTRLVQKSKTFVWIAPSMKSSPGVLIWAARMITRRAAVKPQYKWSGSFQSDVLNDQPSLNLGVEVWVDRFEPTP